MATPATSAQAFHLEILTNYLVSMARSVEMNVDRALAAILQTTSSDRRQSPSEIFLLEPRVNEMEIVIDEHAVRMLRAGNLSSEEIRQVVATLKITNDLERMGDLAVNLAERIISLAEMPAVAAPPELEPMVAAVRAMIKKSLGALIFKNVVLAGEVLESDDLVDRYRDEIFERQACGSLPAMSRQIFNSCLPAAIWSVSPITPRTLPRTSSSGCAALTCAIAEAPI
jgi:phosphate transport system protein